METQVQWLLGANYTELAPEQQPLECVQEPGDVVYLPDGWLHATVSLGPTIAFTRNSFDSTEGVGHYYHLDQFAIAVGRADEAAALAAALAGKVPVDEATVIMVTGGNTDADSFAATLVEV